MRITVRQYYGGFVSLWGIAAGAPFIPPLLHAFFPDTSRLADYLYPPLGDAEWIAVAATIGFLLASTFVAFTCCESVKKIHRRAALILWGGIALCACALIVLYVLYVRRVPISSVDLEVPVSISYQKTDFARQTFPQLTDVEILQRTGPTEDQTQKLWTPHSGSVNRESTSLGLLYSHCGLLPFGHKSHRLSARGRGKFNNCELRSGRRRLTHGISRYRLPR